MKKKLSMALKILNYIVVTFVVLCFISVIYNKIRNPNSKPTVFGFQLYVDVTNSMIPDLHVNDIIIIKKYDKEKIYVGDIITFRENNSTVTHRVIEIINKDNQTLYRTKGDNNNSEDDRLVPYEEVEGKYFFKICYLGFFITDKISLVLIVLIILIISFFPYNKLDFSNKKDDIEDKEKLN